MRYNGTMSELAATLDALWVIHHLDEEIVRHQARIDKDNRANTNEQGRVKLAETRLSDEIETLRKLKVQHRELEGELKRMDARVTQLDQQGTTTGMEAAAKQRDKIDDMETQGLELLGAITAQEGRIKEAEEHLKQRQEGLDASIKATGVSSGEAQQAIDGLQAQRATACATVPPELLHVYEDVQARNPGSALTRVKDGYCAACQGELRPQLSVQIRQRAEIIRCPHCGRILDV